MLYDKIYCTVVVMLPLHLYGYAEHVCGTAMLMVYENQDVADVTLHHVHALPMDRMRQTTLSKLRLNPRTKTDPQPQNQPTFSTIVPAVIVKPTVPPNQQQVKTPKPVCGVTVRQ